MSCWMVRICGLIWLPSFWVTLAAITGRETPQALGKGDHELILLEPCRIDFEF